MERGQEDPYEAVLAFCDELEYYYGEGIPDHYYVRQTDKEGTDEEYMYVQDGEIVYAAKPPFRADIWVPLYFSRCSCCMLYLLCREEALPL